MALNSSHSASTTLDDIITELKLTYDSSVGILDGEAVREIPGVNILLNFSKLLGNLAKELKDVEQTDTKVLGLVEAALNPETVKEEPEEPIADASVAETAAKKRSQEDDQEDDLESISLAKRQKVAPKEEEEPAAVPVDEVAPEKTESTINTASDPVPPVQQGSFTQDNDTRLKNPKSEFVSSQTLSTAAVAELGLFSEDNNGLETQGTEYLKKKYGVASYPENDLQDLLPGKIPDTDFSKTKAPSNQVQFTTFQSYIESFYRLFSNDDIKFLEEKNIIPPGLEKNSYDPDVSPFIIPKLGQFYADVWGDEDSSLASKLNSPSFQQPSLESYKAKGSADTLTDDKLYTEDISCGPLSSRLLSAILSIHEGPTDNDDQENGSAKEEGSTLTQEDDVASQLNSGEEYKLITESNDFHSIEERLKRELKYIGIFMNLPNDEDDSKNKLRINGRTIKSESRSGSIIDSDDWIKNKEDDEVCAEMRALQKELKEAVVKNRRNKKKLIPIIQEQIAYQEYCTILEDLDKQVDQAYLKRLKAKSKKKKTEKIEINPAQQQAMNTGLKSLLEKRRRWIDTIGSLFRPPELMKRVPNESVLAGDDEEEVEEDANDDAEDAIIQEKT